MPRASSESGIGFIQNYFGQPLALIVVCAVFVPIYQRLKVYTAYQYLESDSTAKRSYSARSSFSSNEVSLRGSRSTHRPLFSQRYSGGA